VGVGLPEGRPRPLSNSKSMCLTPRVILAKGWPNASTRITLAMKRLFQHLAMPTKSRSAESIVVQEPNSLSPPPKIAPEACCRTLRLSQPSIRPSRMHESVRMSYLIREAVLMQSCPLCS
jgi:hypothetical protein